MDAAGIEALRKQFLDGLASNPAVSGSQKERPPLEEMYDAVMGFVHAVDWTDPFIIGIVAAIVTMYVVVFATRKHVDAQIALLAIVCAVAYAAPHASRVLSPYWEQLARQDYFDKHGYFGSMMVSLPLMVLALIQMGMAFCSASTLLVQYKRKQLRVDSKAAAKPDTAEKDTASKSKSKQKKTKGSPRTEDASKAKTE